MSLKRHHPVNSDEVLEMLDCPICFTQFKNPVTAKCGHTFCSGCLRRCLKKKHECPECKSHTTAKELVRNKKIAILGKQITQLRSKVKHKEMKELAGCNPKKSKSELLPMILKSVSKRVADFDTQCESAIREMRLRCAQLQSRVASSATDPLQL